MGNIDESVFDRARRMRDTGCVIPSELYQASMEQGGNDYGTRLYREAMIHAGGVVKSNGDMFYVCPICHQPLGETHGRPATERI